MIRAGQLKATIARSFHLPARKVEYPYRVALENAEISRGKRGKGGAAVTPADSAKAIIAVVASFVGDDVLRGIREFSALQLAHIQHNSLKHLLSGPVGSGVPQDDYATIKGGPWQFQGYALPHLQSLARRHTFAEALTAVIEAARDFAFEDALSSAHPKEKHRSHTIEVVFWGPKPKAGIEINLSAGTRTYQEQATYLAPDWPHNINTNEDAAEAAFEITIKIDFQPIYAIANLFRGAQ